jgi:hypothetical protein
MASDLAPVAEAATVESPNSAVSWPAIFAGAVVAVATSLILVALSAGFGLAALSPWQGLASDATTFAIMSGISLIVVQWFASAMGGYLTGRLRTRWTGVHTHEVFFRDTAHGFLTWAVATSFVAALGVFAAAGGGEDAEGGAGAAVQAGVAAKGASLAGLAYDADTIFRAPNIEAGVLAPAKAEAVLILAEANGGGGLSTDDQAYLVGSASARAGITPAEAQTRVATVMAREKAAAAAIVRDADAARKAAAASSIFTAISLLIGAFIACVAAALGGQERDKHV